MPRRLLALAKPLMVRAGLEIASPENARFAKVAGASCMLYAISSVLGILVNIILARMLGAAGLGAYAAALAAVTFLLVLTNTGVPAAVVRYIPIYTKRGDAPLARSCATWGYAHVAVGAIVGASSLVIAVAASDWLEPATRATYLAAALVLPMWAVVTLQSAVLQGYEQSIPARIPDLVVRPAVLILLLLSWWLVTGTKARAPDVAMMLHAAALFAAVAAGAGMLRMIKCRWPMKAPWSGEIRAWYKMAGPITTTQIAEAALAQSALLILPWYAGMEEVGCFRAALSASMLVALPATAVMMALPPIIARLSAAGETAALRSLAALAARLSLILCLPIAAVLCLLGRTVLELLFGTEFAGAYPLLLILLLGQVATVLVGGNANWLLRVYGHQREEANALLAVALVQIATLLLLIPLIGGIGAAVGHSGGYVLLGILLFLLAMRHARVDPTALGLNVREQ